MPSYRGIWTFVISTCPCGSRDWDLSGDHPPRLTFGDLGCFFCSLCASIVTISSIVCGLLGPTKFVSYLACAIILGGGVDDLGLYVASCADCVLGLVNVVIATSCTWQSSFHMLSLLEDKKFPFIFFIIRLHSRRFPSSFTLPL